MNNPVMLAVDDNQDNLIVLKHLITQNFNHCTLFTAENAEKGLELIREVKCDIVLTDVQMPGINGIDFCKMIKASPETSDIIVLMLTSHRQGPELVADGLNAGAFDFITKPIDTQELVARINAALRIKSAETKLQKTQEELELKVIERTKALEQANLKLQNEIKERIQAYEGFQQLMAAIEQVEDIIIITDTDAAIQYVNPSFERVTGYAKEEVISRNPRFLKSGQHPETFYQNMWTTLTCGEVWSGRMINRRKDGVFYDEEATITPIKDQTGKVCNYMAVKRDVTNKVKLEQQLRQAQKMEAIGTLAGGIAHDFNNILFAIQGYNSLSLRLLENNHPIYPHLQKLGQAANRAKELVSQILTFSRQSEQSLKPIQMQPVVKEALNLLRASIPTTIEVMQDIHSEGGLILCDITHLHQIVINLATNAYQAMRDRGGVLTVSLLSTWIDPAVESKYEAMKPGRYMELKVSDTGHGMDRNTMERIFEPYFSTKGQGEGTGLGLSIVHGIIASCGGKIFVESTKGEGTTFQVLLPELDLPNTVDLEEETNLSELKGSEHILVIDDEPQITDILRNMLEELGYTVEVYTNSELLLNDFIKHPHQCDLIITDMTMPKLTGADLAQRLLAIRPSLPIILCTGYSDRIDAALAKQIGIREFILKPVSFQVLARVVRNAFKTPNHP